MLEEADAPVDATPLPDIAAVPVPDAKPKFRQRVARRIGGWMVRRLQKRVEREWRDYDHTPRVSLGPWSRRPDGQGGTQVYRSLVQIHFHPRERAARNRN